MTLEYERQYARDLTELPARLFLSTGSLEKNMTQNLQEFTQILRERNYKDLEWSYSPCEGDIHQTAWLAALGRAIRYVYSSPKKD